MIDWTKPIQTVDGRKARLVETHLENLWHIVYAYPDPESCGSKHDVFLVNFEGYRCDDRVIYSKRPAPFIRNVRVKREGWVRVNSNNGTPYTISDVVFREKASAEEACIRLGGIPAFITWEE